MCLCTYLCTCLHTPGAELSYAHMSIHMSAHISAHVSAHTSAHVSSHISRCASISVQVLTDKVVLLKITREDCIRLQREEPPLSNQLLLVIIRQALANSWVNDAIFGATGQCAVGV